MSGYIHCEKHGHNVLGYLTCHHVYEGSIKVSRVYPADPYQPGAIECQACVDRRQMNLGDYVLICEKCAQARQLLQP